jgi:hypothetical protein
MCGKTTYLVPMISDNILYQPYPCYIAKKAEHTIISCGSKVDISAINDSIGSLSPWLPLCVCI